MKWVAYAVSGLICLAMVDKWAGLGFIWPETPEKQPNRPRTVSKWHPSVANNLSAAANVVDFDSYYRWYRQQWSVE